MRGLKTCPEEPPADVPCSRSAHWPKSSTSHSSSSWNAPARSSEKSTAGSADAGGAALRPGGEQRLDDRVAEAHVVLGPRARGVGRDARERHVTPEQGLVKA